MVTRMRTAKWTLIPVVVLLIIGSAGGISQ
jgi:hypothetical protein